MGIRRLSLWVLSVGLQNLQHFRVVLLFVSV